MGQDQPFKVSFQSLYKVWWQCQRHKSGKAVAQRYEMNLLENLFDTQKQLCQAAYQPTMSYCFVTGSPKLREIHAACFRDRVVHHWLVPRLEVLWEPWFTYDVYSNRKHKGTHKAVQRLQKWMRKADIDYFLQLDIKNFFYSIYHHTLLNLLNRGLKKAVRQNQRDIQQAQFLFHLSKTFVSADYSQAQQLDPDMTGSILTPYAGLLK